MKVLDIGSGAGGSAFYMARHYGVDVQGVDLSTNMNAISLEYRKQMEPEVKHRCHFYIEDADKMEFPENFFDIVYSRDTLMVSDYCRGEKPSPQVFIDYEAQRGYNLWTGKGQVANGHTSILANGGETDIRQRKLA